MTILWSQKCQAYVLSAQPPVDHKKTPKLIIFGKDEQRLSETLLEIGAGWRKTLFVMPSSFREIKNWYTKRKDKFLPVLEYV